jgi:hypothetical protein
MLTFAIPKIEFLGIVECSQMLDVHADSTVMFISFWFIFFKNSGGHI